MKALEVTQCWREALPCLFAICFLSSGCAQDNAKNQQIPTLEFNIVDSLLDSHVYNASGLCYRIPIGWRNIPDSLFAKTMEIVKTQQPQVPLQIWSGYVDPHGMVYLILSRIQEQDTAFARRLLQEYSLLLSKDFKVYPTTFLVNNLNVFQLLADAKDRILIRLIFWSQQLDSLVQFDFIIPRSYYWVNLKRIESVIGSVSVCTVTHQ